MLQSFFYSVVILFIFLSSSSLPIPLTSINSSTAAKLCSSVLNFIILSATASPTPSSVLSSSSVAVFMFIASSAFSYTSKIESLFASLNSSIENMPSIHTSANIIAPPTSLLPRKTFTAISKERIFSYPLFPFFICFQEYMLQ